jgi:hypothetical protein
VAPTLVVEHLEASFVPYPFGSLGPTNVPDVTEGGRCTASNRADIVAKELVMDWPTATVIIVIVIAFMVVLTTWMGIRYKK